jgi:3-hydroxyisobutyrate dehydrogenase-like beta-hydroxyacid dehydrogenase
MRDAVIVEAVRTPIGRRNGGLSGVHPADLSAHVLTALAERAGIDRARAYDVLMAGADASPYVEYKRDAFLDPDSMAVAFSIDLMAKDVGLALRVAHETGVTVPLGETVGWELERARAAGLGERDVAGVLGLYA